MPPQIYLQNNISPSRLRWKTFFRSKFHDCSSLFSAMVDSSWYRSWPPSTHHHHSDLLMHHQRLEVGAKYNMINLSNNDDDNDEDN